MFKKNPNRPPIVISLKKITSGYKVLPNDSFNPFSFKKITRAVFRSDLYHPNSQGQDQNNGGMGSALLQAPSHITIPVSAKWFDINQIHQIEKEAFPEFFLLEEEEGKLFKKTARLYKFYRNAIYELWKQNCKKYLSPALCRKNLPGDVSSIIRIHSFLEHWGLINFPSKQPTKGYLIEKPKNYSCLICQSTSAYEYYLHQIQSGIILQLCNICYKNKFFPECFWDSEFKKIIPEVHEKRRLQQKMSEQEIQKMLQIIHSENMKEKQIWNSLGKNFPNFTREELILNFLELPIHHKINTTIFDGFDDYIHEEDPPSQEQPTIFEHFQNPEQIGIAIAYYTWKTKPNKYPELKQLFEGATRNAEYLQRVQFKKAQEMLRMMTDVKLSKIQLKAIFIQEFGKLLEAEEVQYTKLVQNCMADALKSQQISQ